VFQERFNALMVTNTILCAFFDQQQGCKGLIMCKLNLPGSIESTPKPQLLSSGVSRGLSMVSKFANYHALFVFLVCGLRLTAA
jgi:hypothetical protein